MEQHDRTNLEQIQTYLAEAELQNSSREEDIENHNEISDSGDNSLADPLIELDFRRSTDDLDSHSELNEKEILFALFLKLYGVEEEDSQPSIEELSYIQSWLNIARGTLVYAEVSQPHIEKIPIEPSLENMEKQEQEIPKEDIIDEETKENIKNSEIIHVEKVGLKPRIPFQRKKLDLAIYGFDELPIEPILEDKILETSHANHEEYLSSNDGCNFLE